MYGDSCPSTATVKSWFNEFHRGRISVFYEPHTGAPKMATMEDNETKNILHKILGMRKLPRLLTLDNKPNRVTTSEQSLALFKHNSKGFLHHFVTGTHHIPRNS